MQQMWIKQPGDQFVEVLGELKGCVCVWVGGCVSVGVCVFVYTLDLLKAFLEGLKKQT